MFVKEADRNASEKQLVGVQTQWLLFKFSLSIYLGNDAEYKMELLHFWIQYISLSSFKGEIKLRVLLHQSGLFLS